MATYSMQTAKIPRSICDNIDMKTRRFIWGDNEDKRDTHLISWENLQKPMKSGGFAIATKLAHQNLAVTVSFMDNIKHVSHKL